MQHSMVLVEEKSMIIIVGGEDENGNVLDSCEIMNIKENSWKVFSSLNNKGKNLGLCKFTKENRRSGEKFIYIYAFNNNIIERINVNSLKIDTKWEILKVKSMVPLNTSCASVQFDDNLILLFGGANEQNMLTQDIVFYNQTFGIIEKAQTTSLSMSDKFVGGSMTQYVINRLECKIFFSSDKIVHEIEYGSKAGEAMFKSRVILY